MKTWWALAYGVVSGLLGAGVVWLAASPPRGQPITLAPPPTPAPIVVHVAGAVAAPGVYALPVGSRVQDALQAAGGLAPEANPQALNLAAPLQDGEQLRIPLQGPATSSPGPAPAGQSAPTENGLPGGALINLNTATQSELESLPGIGPATAQKIIAFREEHGPFQAIEDVLDVSGIGPATFDRIKGLITVADAP